MGEVRFSGFRGGGVGSEAISKYLGGLGLKGGVKNFRGKASLRDAMRLID